MSSRYRTPSSGLLSPAPPPSYGSVIHNNGQPSNGQGYRPPVHAPHYATPTPPSLQSPDMERQHAGEPAQRRNATSCGLVSICFWIILFQTMMIIYRSDTLAGLIDLESAARHASREKSALAAERELWKREEGKWKREEEKMRVDKELWERERDKLEQEREGMRGDREERGRLERERERMKHERDLWERAREDRVPHGAFWDAVSPALECLEYAKREYWATLKNIPEGWSAVDACTNLPVEIHGVTIRRPYRCALVDGSSDIRGYWMVDWDQPDCRPWWYNYQDAGCTSYKSGSRRIEGQLVGINDKGNQDWWLLCNSTPLVWNSIAYTSPTHCQARDWGAKIGMWDVPDASCL